MRIPALLACALLLAAPVLGQSGAPTVPELDQLKIRVQVQAIEIAQLKAQAAQRDFDAAREALRVLVAGLDRPGYTLDLQTLSYQPIEGRKP